MSPVFAQNQDPLQLPAPYTSPDKGLTYFFWTKLIEPTKLFFSFGDAAKAETYLAQAKERAAELTHMNTVGDHSFDDQLTSAYKKALNQSENHVIAIVDPQTRAAIEAHILNETSKHIIVLERVLANAPPQAKEGLSRAISNAGRVFTRIQALTNATEAAITTGTQTVCIGHGQQYPPPCYTISYSAFSIYSSSRPGITLTQSGTARR